LKFSISKTLVLASIAFAASSQASVAHLTLNGTPGDYISQGKNVDNVYSSKDPLLTWNFANYIDIGTSAAPATNYLSFIYLFSSAGDDKYTMLDFSTKGLGVAMTAGGTYTSAERAAFATSGHPGLDVSYGHRGCNTLSGSFTVNQLSFKAGALDTFGASFKQSCDGGSLMTGSFYYNASLTELPTSSASVPEPAPLALLGLGIAGIGFVRRRKQSQ
jgi:hypothetical protein